MNVLMNVMVLDGGDAYMAVPRATRTTLTVIYLDDLMEPWMIWTIAEMST